MKVINQRHLKICVDVADTVLMHRPYLKIWEWEWLFGRVVKIIFSLGVTDITILFKKDIS